MIRSVFAVVIALTAVGVPTPGGEADAAKRIVFETAQTVVGEVQRPQVSVVMTRENLNDPYDFNLQESFLPKIVDAVRRSPF
jgi:hypothetical protein